MESSTYALALLALSMVLQFAAGIVIAFSAIRYTRPWILLLGLGFGLMGARRAVSLLAALAGDASPHVPSELVALVITLVTSGAAIEIYGWARESARGSRRFSGHATGAQTGAQKGGGEKSGRSLGVGVLQRWALLLGGAGVLVACLVLYISYDSGRHASLETFGRRAARVADLVVSRVDSNQAETALASLAHAWRELGPTFEGSYLCVIRNGEITLHTRDPSMVGRSVRSQKLTRPDHSETTLPRLAEERGTWVGPFTGPAGEPQVAAFAYSERLDGLVAIHIPQRTILKNLNSHLLPWLLGTLVVALVLLPASIFLYHQAVHNAHDALSSSEARLRAVLDAHPDVVMVVGPDGRVEDQISPRDGRCEDTLCGLEIEGGVPPEILLRHVVDSGRREHIRYQILGGESKQTYAASVVPIELGEHRSVLWVARDVSAEERLSAENIQLERQLVASQKLETVGTLAGGIAHDFNNILTPIITCVSMATDDLEAGEVDAKDLETILSAAMRARDLVTQILSFSRQDRAEMTEVDLGEIVRESVHLLRSSVPNSIELCHQIPEGRVSVLGNATQLQQVILNAAVNSAHAIGSRSGKIEIVLEDREADVLLSIRDDGPGMDAATRERVFEPFFTTRVRGHGTGLGMAVAHGVVMAHRGSIDVKSEPGRGTIVAVHLPRFHGSAQCQLDFTVETLSSASVLIVDDEAGVSSSLAELLERHGNRVRWTTSPRIALAMLDGGAEAYDVLLTDLTMPELLGTDLAREVRRRGMRVGIVLMTGHPCPLEAEDDDIDAFVRKPMDPRELLTALAGAVRARDARVVAHA